MGAEIKGEDVVAVGDEVGGEEEVAALVGAEAVAEQDGVAAPLDGAAAVGR